MQRTFIRWLLFVGLAAFVPLFYYLAVVGGLLPYGGILLIAIRNLSNSSILLLSLIHLTISPERSELTRPSAVPWTA